MAGQAPWLKNARRAKSRLAKTGRQIRSGQDPDGSMPSVRYYLISMQKPILPRDRTGEPAAPFRDRGRDAGWSSLVARQAHNLKVVGSNPTPATKIKPLKTKTFSGVFSCLEKGQLGGLANDWQTMRMSIWTIRGSARAAIRACGPKWQSLLDAPTGSGTEPKLSMTVRGVRRPGRCGGPSQVRQPVSACTFRVMNQG